MKFDFWPDPGLELHALEHKKKIAHILIIENVVWMIIPLFFYAFLMGEFNKHISKAS